jgi:hypothetical protein
MISSVIGTMAMITARVTARMAARMMMAVRGPRGTITVIACPVGACYLGI